MNCYVCILEGVTTTSVSFCIRCGVALCLEHLKKGGTYSVGGTKYGCPHTPMKAERTQHSARATG